MNLHSPVFAAERIENCLFFLVLLFFLLQLYTATTATTQWTWNTLGLVINDKATFTTFICDFVFYFSFHFFTPFPSFECEWGYTIKYPIKFCIFYNLMRDLCVRTFFFSVQENIIQKRKRKYIHQHYLTSTSFGVSSHVLSVREL